MFNHEHFRKLTALAGIGQLSSDENRVLETHLTECADCRRRQEDYSRIIFHELPKVDPRGTTNAARPRLVTDVDRRDRFLARARAEGIELSSDFERSPALEISNSKPSWQWQPGIAIAALALITLTTIWVNRKYELVSRSPHSSTLPRPIQARVSTDVQAQVSSLRQIITERSDELRELKRQNSISDESLRRIQAELGNAQTKAAELSAELSQSNSEKADFNLAAQQKDSVIADLREQNDSLSRKRADNLSDSVIQAARIRELTQSLDEERANLERERQLMAASNDVRQLMGARNLHIIDVLDVNGGSRSAKAFGRVFYAEGQSLIFYAFDLPTSGLSPAKYTFQAWGQAEAKPLPSRKLGVFEVDNHDQHRWVLKINDSGLLTGIDSVFVTAESLGEAKEPRGKKLLYAYIGGQPNHP
jgi:hypothetical protein